MMASLYTPAQLIPLPTLLLAPVRVGPQQGEGIRKVLSVGFADAHSVWEEVRPQWLRVTRASGVVVGGDGREPVAWSASPSYKGESFLPPSSVRHTQKHSREGARLPLRASGVVGRG